VKIMSYKQKSDKNVLNNQTRVALSYFLPVLDSTRSFLSVSRREFVSYLGDAHRTHSNLAEFVTFRVEGQHHLVDDSGLAVAEECRGVPLGEAFGGAVQLKTFRNTTLDGISILKLVLLTSSSFSGRVIVFPMTTSSPDTRIPGDMIPSSSSLS
jgi:hypothetical protein